MMNQKREMCIRDRTVTTNSWFEPVLYLTVMGVAIVLNKGTNLFIGRISFLTNSVSACLLYTSGKYVWAAAGI